MTMRRGERLEESCYNTKQGNSEGVCVCVYVCMGGGVLIWKQIECLNLVPVMRSG